MLQLLAQNRERLGLAVVFKAEAGLILTGAEVKAAKSKNLNPTGAHLRFLGGEPYLVGLRIGRYQKAGPNADERRTRKVLLKKREIEKIAGLLSQKGCVCIAGEVYAKESLVKVELLVGRRLKQREKKEKLIEKQLDRDQEREWHLL